jgi:CrcB protein
VQRVADESFPTGTLVVNVVGSFIIGLIMTLSLERGYFDEDLRIMLSVGFCGGFTTMSAFSYEMVALLRDGEHLLAAGNAGLMFVTCLGAVWFGTIIARAL